MLDRQPTIRSRELGLALTRAAEAKGMNGNAIARRLGWSHSKVSRLLSGKRGSSKIEDVAALLAICDITGPKRDELLEIARRANERGWWQEYGDRLPPEPAKEIPERIDHRLQRQSCSISARGCAAGRPEPARPSSTAAQRPNPPSP